MTTTHVLHYGRPVPEPDVAKWCRWMLGNRRVVLVERCGVAVETTFVGVDHGRGLLWKTEIHGGEWDGWQVPYASVGDALAGFDRACSLAWPAKKS